MKHLKSLLVLLLVVMALLVSGLSLVSAESPEEDGRINAVAHLGGAAVYCVDGNMNVDDTYAEGGLRILAMNGEELLFVSNARIAEVGENPAQNTLLGAANGLELYRLVGGAFQLNGYNEHNEKFEFIFPSCEPIGPAVEDPEPKEDPCEDFIYIAKATRSAAPFEPHPCCPQFTSLFSNVDYDPCYFNPCIDHFQFAPKGKEERLLLKGTLVIC